MKVAKELLLELNEDVKGEHVEEDPANLIREKKDFFSDFQLVIACGLNDELSRELCSICETKNTSLILLR